FYTFIYYAQLWINEACAIIGTMLPQLHPRLMLFGFVFTLTRFGFAVFISLYLHGFARMMVAFTCTVPKATFSFAFL
ncbi:hypothetical protein ACJX0J_009777, partial [Zea mays]